MYCIKCENIVKIDLIYPKCESEEQAIWRNSEIDKNYDDDLTISSFNSEDGVTKVVGMGYGSNLDGDQLVVSICDKCLSDGLKDGLVLYWGNYLYDGAPFVSEEIHKSRKIYRRRKNLDNIT